MDFERRIAGLCVVGSVVVTHLVVQGFPTVICRQSHVSLKERL